MNVYVHTCIHSCICASLSYLPGLYASVLKMSSSLSNHLENAYSLLRIHVKYHLSFLNKQRVGSLKIILGFLICNIEIMLALLKSQTVRVE